MDGIEFGQVEFREPELELRPDRNRKFAVVACGEVDQRQLPIFVDLDVMRDMEGHARTNTHVELGGVLLGGKFVDDQGRSFVVVQEALRAEHYEATRGSFKFTHDTWEQIARDREQFPESMILVGWYHTHPDWGVFLSGMDTFICDNFFGDDLDIDLVIDPCRGDRGWFFWDDVDGARSKQRVSGFYLFANRYRRSELLQFAEALSIKNPAYFDPRYETPMGETTMQPVVNIHDQKSPVLMVAVLGMLTVQMLVLGLIAWRLLSPPDAAIPWAQQQRNNIYRELLGQMAGPTADGTKMLERIDNLALQNREMKTDLDGRGLLVDNLKNQNEKLARSIKTGKDSLDRKSETVIRRDDEINSLNEKLKTEKGLNADIKKGVSIGGLKWPIVTAIGLATALTGILLGTLVGKHLREDEDYYGDSSELPTNHPPDNPQSAPSADVTMGDGSESGNS